MQRFTISLVALSLIAVPSLAAETESQPASEPAPEPLTQPAGPVAFPLAQAQPLEYFDGTLAEMARRYTAFRPDLATTKGVNHLTLPFRYTSLNAGGEPAEALAFSFLLSNALDWLPGNYCTRHAYYVFKRDRRRMKPFTEQYDRRRIGQRIRFWNATHAVGGVLIQSGRGYSGSLQIFDPAGRVVLQQDYVTPREYFELLGQMAADAMQFFGYEPNEKLVEHLKMRRCTFRTSLVELGQAAFGRLRSDEVFEIYDTILQREPGFADVRYWYANQKWWADGDTAHRRQQYYRLLQDYLVLPALVNFNPAKDKAAGVEQAYRRWMDDAEQLTGPGCPDLLQQRIELMLHANQEVPAPMRQTALEALKRFGNSYWLAYHLGRAYSYADPPDHDIAAGCFLTALRSRFMTSQYDHHPQLFAGWSLRHLGHHAAAATIYRKLLADLKRHGRDSQVPNVAGRLGHTLMSMGRYEEAIGYLQQAFEGYKDKPKKRNKMLVSAGVSAALAGRMDILERILRDRSAELEETGMKVLVEAYRDVAAGKHFDIRQFWQTARKDMNFWQQKDLLILCCQVWLMRGDPTGFRPKINELVGLDPTRRQAWIIFDGYDRLDPRADSASFYEALQWLHGDDPWVKKAAADFSIRVAEPEVIPLAQLVQRLDRYEQVLAGGDTVEIVDYGWSLINELPALSFAATCKRLCDEGRFDEAEQLAVRLRQLHRGVNAYALSVHAMRLWHKVRAERQDSRKQ